MLAGLRSYYVRMIAVMVRMPTETVNLTYVNVWVIYINFG